MFTDPISTNAIAYVLPGNPATLIYTASLASTVNTEATNISTTGKFTDGTVVVWAQKHAGVLVNNVLNDVTTQLITRGTVTALYGEQPNVNANMLFNPLNLTVSKSRLEPVLATGKANNVGVFNTYNVIEPTTTGNFSLTGLVGGAPQLDGTVVIVAYYGTDVMTIVNNSSDSATGNKIFTATGADVVYTGRGNAILVYDSALDSGSGGWNLVVAAL